MSEIAVLDFLEGVAGCTTLRSRSRFFPRFTPAISSSTAQTAAVSCMAWPVAMAAS